jgi:hypothetical protein
MERGRFRQCGDSYPRSNVATRSPTFIWTIRGTSVFSAIGDTPLADVPPDQQHHLSFSHSA